MADTSRRPHSKATVSSVATKATKSTQKSVVTTTTQKSGSEGQSVQKSSQNKKAQKAKNYHDSAMNKDNDHVTQGNTNGFSEILKVQKNKLQVLEMNEFFDSLRSADLEIEVKEDVVELKGLTKETVDEVHYKIDKKCKEIATKLDNVGNLKSKFLRKQNVTEYINFILMQERILCSWEVNEKVHDLHVFALSQVVATEGSKVIKTCIQSIEIDKEQLEFIELQEFLKDNKKVWAVPRKKKGDIVLLMTNDQYVLYQRIFNPIPENGSTQNQVLHVPLSQWKLEYFKTYADQKLKSLCNLYKVDHRFFHNHIELHGWDPEIVKIDIDRMANEIFISLEHSFGNAPNLTKAIEEKRVHLEKQKQCMINISNKARPHSGWLGNRRDVMMHIINMIGPVETCDCDVLICPVNRNLDAFGIGKDILTIGGKPINTDIDKLLKNSEESRAPIEPEEIIVLQNTGNLKCQLLLLTVIPPWTREKDVSLSLLNNCARRIIHIVSDSGYRSIGIPLDVADDFPSHMYASLLINNFWKMRQKFGHFMHVFGYADTQSTVEDIDEFLMSEILILGHWSHIVFDKPKHFKERQTSEITVNIVEGSIVDMDKKVDVIVNATNHKDLEHGAMSRELIHKAGRDNIVREYLHMYPDGIGVCDVAVTQPGKLKCQYLFHGCLFGWIMNGNLSVKMLKLFVNRCLAEAERRQCTSIAFPALGSYLMIFPPVLVAKMMFKAVEKFGETENPKYLKTVNFVLNPLEETVTEMFRNIQDWMVSRNNQLITYDLPPKHIQCIHKKHGIRFVVAAIDHYRDIQYKEVKVNVMFVSKEEQKEIGKPLWDITSGSYTVTLKVIRTEKSLTQGLNKMVDMLETYRFHVMDVVLLNSRDAAGIMKESKSPSFGPWQEPEKTSKQPSGMSLHKQIDLVMSTVVKSTDKIYEGDRKSETADPNISYIRVVRMFATTADFKDMMKQLKKGGVSKENRATSSWHISEKKPQKYKYHIQAIGKRDDTDAVLDTLKTDITHMEEPRRVHFKIAPPVKKVTKKIDSLHRSGYNITLDEAGKKAVLDGTTKEVVEVRKELEDFIDNTLVINLAEDDFTALIHLGKREDWFKEIATYVFDRGTLVLTHKKGVNPEPLLKNLKDKMEEIRKMSETDVPLQKKMTIFLEEVEKEVEKEIKGIFCFLSFNKKRIIIKAQNVRKAIDAKFAVQMKLGLVATPRKKKTKDNQANSHASTPGLKNGSQFTTKEGITILTYLADYQKLKVDCLVTPASKNLIPTKGIGQEIAQAAGGQLEKECEAVITEKGNLAVGSCCSTKPGYLPYHCIIHSVAPSWQLYGADQKKKCLEDLRSAIISALHMANSHGHKTIAFTSLGTGVFGVPKPFCAIQYYKGIVEYGKHMNKGDNSIQDIHFVDPDEEMFLTLQKTFSKYLGEGKPI